MSYEGPSTVAQIKQQSIMRRAGHGHGQQCQCHGLTGRADHPASSAQQSWEGGFSRVSQHKHRQRAELSIRSRQPAISIDLVSTSTHIHWQWAADAAMSGETQPAADWTLPYLWARSYCRDLAQRPTSVIACLSHHLNTQMPDRSQAPLPELTGLSIQSDISIHHYDSVALYQTNILQEDPFWAASIALFSSMTTAASRCWYSLAR